MKTKYFLTSEKQLQNYHIYAEQIIHGKHNKTQ